MANNEATSSMTEQDNILVLRIGIVRNNELVDERLVNVGETVTIGSRSSNLFTLEETTDDVGEYFELFEFRNGAYYLHFVGAMDGALRVGDSAIEFNGLRNGDSVSGIRAVEKRGMYSVPLTNECKGKVDIGEYRLLFQFVNSPSVVVQQRKEVLTKDTGFEEDDKIFYSFLGLFSVAAAVILWWISVQPRPELLDKEEVEELIAQYLELDPVEEEPEPIVEPTDEEIEDGVVDPNKVAETKPKEEEKPPEEPTDKPTPEETKNVEKKAQASANMSSEERAAAEDAVSKSFLFQAIGTVGEGSGVVTSAFGGEGGDVDLDAVLDGVTDGQMAVNDAQMSVKGQIDKSGKAETKVGVVSADGKGGSSVAGPGPKTVAPKSVASINKIDSAMGACSDEINKTVRKYLSQVKTCHDISLKNNPEVAGRVEVDVEISDGVVTLAKVSKNTTGDNAVGSCIEKKIRRWKFPESCTDIAVFPFALSPKN